MLRELSMRNLAIVTEAELELGDGLIVLTGETGAGKSILIDALALALGGKAGQRMIRHDAARAEVSASFHIAPHSPIATWLREQSLDADDECILRRVLNRGGRSRAYINGSPVPRKLLQEAGSLLVSIHGQHAHQALTRNSHQRHLLDRYAGHGELTEEVATLHRALQEARAELEHGLAEARQRQERRDLLEYQIGELQALELDADEWRQLDIEQTRLSRGERLRNGCGAVLEALSGEGPALRETLATQLTRLDELTGSDPRLNEPREALEGALIQVEETAISLRHYLDGLEPDPQRLAEVEQRLALLLDMARKYRVRPEALPGHLDALQQELARQEQGEQRLERLQQTVTKLERDYADAATRLSKKRHAAARRLATVIGRSLQTLAMEGGRFEIQLEPAPAGPQGQDRIEFLVSANPGQPPAPLATVASGGELSRISLAIHAATAGCDDIPTLIFDEVDVGIGGGTASIVGGLLRELARQRQILCITHLPQVAAHGDQHLAVNKSSKRRQTTTHITQLDDTQRIGELARMLGGAVVNETARANARELLQQAGQSTD